MNKEQEKITVPQVGNSQEEPAWRSAMAFIESEGGAEHIDEVIAMIAEYRRKQNEGWDAALARLNQEIGNQRR